MVNSNRSSSDSNRVYMASMLKRKYIKIIHPKSVRSLRQLILKKGGILLVINRLTEVKNDNSSKKSSKSI